ncbi:uncharacterized protein BDZ99DRAFT_462200 [Mytilinidion resinicola]|uniref:Uncharacterized protein n=1 Tax=Mytilinidion resinicola TaxID=574789 RepID=A0A6A6YQU5_9PEZI|nr:uncharacterized protein BDZ99DRAFT_462200 [Mytilinidion resinicola]KAF2810908.1 hypothetical protein BDZ99DRAFT_462200 [Mytilinidion resinicola]
MASETAPISPKDDSTPPNPWANATPIKIADLPPDQKELSRKLRNLHHSPSLLGIWHLGHDGVMRSLSSEREVTDAIPFPPRLIKAMSDRFPFDQKTEDAYRGLDGTKVPEEQWWKPDRSMLPPPLAEESKEKARRGIEEQGGLQAMREKMENERKERDEGKGFRVYILSDYNLDIKEDGLE